MLLNTVLMHGLRENQTSRSYWIVQPPKPKASYHEFYETSPIMDQVSEIVRSQIKCCAHDDNCDSYIYEVKCFHLHTMSIEFNKSSLSSFDTQGIKKYFKLGLGLEIARNLIYNYGLILRNPLKLFEVFIWRLNWNLVFFLAGYVGIYRVGF